MTDAILTLNAGSSSIKFSLFELAGAGELAFLLSGQVEFRAKAVHFEARGKAAELADEHWPETAFDVVLGRLLVWTESHLGADRLVGIGHRVVHGGPDHYKPELVDTRLLTVLGELCDLAPLHVPHNLGPVRAIAAERPGLPQVACFDTAFHYGMPTVATRFGLPRAYHDAGFRRYGFHGLSYEYIARQLKIVAPALGRGRVIVAHLGNGASLCAIKDGLSLDTTMGFTALDGLVMGTRCGVLDPGLVLHLMGREGLDVDAMETMLYKRSGLLGVSGGIASDMRTLLESDAPAARDAVELFVYRIVREAGALASALGGLDGFVFTAGMGEHAAPIRAMVCERLAWLGLEVDPNANSAGAPVISTPSSRVEVRVMATDEERMIAEHTRDLIAPKA